MEEFITILNDETAEIVEKKSKFIANLIHVESIEDAENKIKEIKKKYYDARHNCVAYRVSEGGQIVEKSSDDGEPSGTAGGPMLNILQKNNLCNLVVIVTRYFGGILLGTGGLVRAYSDATLQVIEKATKVIKVQGVKIEVGLDYSNLEIFKYSLLFIYFFPSLHPLLASIKSSLSVLLKDNDIKSNITFITSLYLKQTTVQNFINILFCMLNINLCQNITLL